MEVTGKELKGVMVRGMVGLDSSSKWGWHCPLHSSLQDAVCYEDTKSLLALPGRNNSPLQAFNLAKNSDCAGSGF